MGRETKNRIVEAENQDWMESLDDLFRRQGRERVLDMLSRLRSRAVSYGVKEHASQVTPYINTIPADRQPRYPGRLDIERRIKSFVRWNAMAMVVRANRELSGIGGHISTFASAAALYEVAFHHFLRGPGEDHQVAWQIVDPGRPGTAEIRESASPNGHEEVLVRCRR